MEKEKRVYTTPKCIVCGSVEEITQAAATGAVTDADFPAGTPQGLVTFS